MVQMVRLEQGGGFKWEEAAREGRSNLGIVGDRSGDHSESLIKGNDSEVERHWVLRKVFLLPLLFCPRGVTWALKPRPGDMYPR